MSVASPQVSGNCKRCSRELPAGALDCPQCHALVHEEQLERTAARARAFEANGALWDARRQWQAALPLLPPASKQAEWIRNHILELNVIIDTPGAPDTRRKWAKWLAPLGPLAVLLAKGKTVLLLLFKMKFLLSFGAFIAVYWAAYGAQFGIGFATMILIHELGHFIDVKRRGLPAEMPVFLPGLGAYVKWQALGVPLETRAAVSLAGPLAGWFAAAMCALLWFKTGNGVWGALARAGAWLNILNLTPVWVLDGSQAVLALNRIERALLLAASVAFAFALREWTLLLVGAGMLWRLFTKDQPAEGSRSMTAYFLAVLAALTFVMHLVPAPGLRRETRGQRPKAIGHSREASNHLSSSRETTGSPGVWRDLAFPGANVAHLLQPGNYAGRAAYQLPNYPLTSFPNYQILITFPRPYKRHYSPSAGPCRKSVIRQCPERKFGTQRPYPTTIYWNPAPN